MTTKVNIKTSTGRKANECAPRREPYWEPLQKGAAVGFRKLENGDGTWIARWRDEEGKQKYRALGNFDQYDAAAKAAREWVASCEQGASPKVTTVKEACESYVTELKNEGRATGRWRVVLPADTLIRL